MDLTYKKILVTGADGFIGSHLIEYLLAQGYDVRAFVLYNAFGSWGWLDHLDSSVKKNIDVFVGDIRDAHNVIKAAKNCHVILHLAALIGIPYSYHSPDSYLDTNTRGTLNVLQAAQELNIEKVVHTSTSEVYGTAQFVPISEMHPIIAQSPYSASKIGADQMAISFYRSFSLPVSIIRPFNTYGPRQSTRAFIPTIITQILNKMSPLQVGSLHPTRDFTFVKDLVKAFVAMAEADAAVGEIINIGSNFEISMQETAHLIAQMMDYDIKFTEADERIRPQKSEVERLYADTAKANALINWTPQYGGIDGFKRGLHETIQWFSSRSNLRHFKTDSYAI